MLTIHCSRYVGKVTTNENMHTVNHSCVTCDALQVQELTGSLLIDNGRLLISDTVLYVCRWNIHKWMKQQFNGYTSSGVAISIFRLSIPLPLCCVSHHPLHRQSKLAVPLHRTPPPYLRLHIAAATHGRENMTEKQLLTKNNFHLTWTNWCERMHEK